MTEGGDKEGCGEKDCPQLGCNLRCTIDYDKRISISRCSTEGCKYEKVERLKETG